MEAAKQKAAAMGAGPAPIREAADQPMVRRLHQGDRHRPRTPEAMAGLEADEHDAESG